MFIFCRVLCFHSPYHKTHVICLTRDKSAYHHQSNVPPQLVVCPPHDSREDRDVAARIFWPFFINCIFAIFLQKCLNFDSLGC